MTAWDQISAKLRGGLVVSCQAYPSEPLDGGDAMVRVARSAVLGGAVGVRMQGLEDVGAAASALDVPVIGLWKVGHQGVYITPSLEHARSVAERGVDVVALDGTRRPRPDGLTLRKTVETLKSEFAVAVMADCGSLNDARAAQDAGVDVLSTALAGYTGERPRTDGPDLELIEQIAARVSVPVVAEGRIHTPTQGRRALDVGAFAVCVGTAITHPQTITRWFAQALE